MIGIDLISIPRMERFIERHGQRGLGRFLNDDEILLATTPKTAAGFWAIKEAVAKALGCGIGSDLGFHDIVIEKTPKGAPFVTLSPKAILTHQIRNLSVSVTHDADLAIAVAIPNQNL